jgi:hypothetical protein
MILVVCKEAYFWCEPRYHMVTQPTHKDTNSQKANLIRFDRSVTQR